VTRPTGSRTGRLVDDQCGSVTALALILVMLVASILLALTGLVALAQDQGRAQTIADLSALAGAQSGEGAARELAVAHGAELTRFTVNGAVVTTRVSLGDATASASAVWVGGGG